MAFEEILMRKRMLYVVIVCIVLVCGEENVQYSNDDHTALLSFMTGIVSDPEHVLESWNSTGVHMCAWKGVMCNTARTHVVQLDLSGNSLQGTISPALSNLSYLTVLDLSDNFFSGHIPKELGSLFRLKQLSFSSNVLEGDIPTDLGQLNRLVYFNLGSNRLEGQIPPSLFCNGTSSLQYVDLSNNSLTGKIPLWDQCELLELRFLLLWSNKLVGQIPPTLSKSSKLEWLDLESNSLNGELPVEIVKNMPRLQFLYLSDNNFIAHSGNSNLTPFFASLVNCSNLQELEVAGNSLGGEIPSIIGDLSTSLVQINLGENHIYGSIPPSIANLVNVTLLNFSSNLLNGSIPSGISRMRKLERVYLSNNSFSDLSKNRLSGSIPDSLSNLFQLRRLLLFDNHLTGTIPPSLGQCINLEILDLSHNRISGMIPSEVAGLSSLKLYLNLSNNFLEGSIPFELSKMDMILAIDFSSNNLSGAIPAQLGSCIALESLNLSRNLLHGHFPVPIGKLPYLQELDISSNQLTGDILQFLQVSATLKNLKISFNNFSGTIPKDGIFKSITVYSLQGNPGLCGSLSGMPPCKKKKILRSIIMPVLIMLIGTPIVCCFGYPLVFRARTRQKSAIFVEDVSDDEEQATTRSKYPRISYQQLVEATGGFNNSSLIGSGSFGHVYKGVLQDNTRIAVKVLNLKMGGETGSFKRECQVLRRIRHRNLIRIITACSRPDFKALVLPLMSNGSLESHIYPATGSSQSLNLLQLVSICTDIAEGVAYLHHHAPMQVVHCDLKPSNILLDKDMTALVTDFGIAKLVKGGDGQGCEDPADLHLFSISSTEGLLCGSIGYIAPEYGLGRHASTEGDVYSFGVLLLEFITGKRPTDILFQEGSNLAEWVKSLYPNKLEPIAQQALLRFPPPGTPVYTKIFQDVIYEMIELGLMCTQRSPSMRPSMLDVAHEMGWLKQYLSNPSTLPI
ncbi:hypothetical protein AQUCO_01600294v1 [Aquilegia coerulea]|uniref:non-specific serine/threonine protein kinase n=1 Tax=Aquilegia coerulea TaxID=218851 RepID=A0A2G5DR07_AQUCA|nr:hypothetical protein AQUCO_01600294v1 [Aquilegia coerulea]